MSLIADWRDKWQKPQMPFYFVQLSNHGKKEEIQDDSDWAAIREAQAQALHLNHTGMVVTTDIGKGKSNTFQSTLETGLRLSQLALKQTYGKEKCLNIRFTKATASKEIPFVSILKI